MVECTICLYCPVTLWSYHRDVPLSEGSEENILLSLVGEAEFRGFIERMPFDVRVVRGPVDAEFVDAKVLSVDDAMPEYDLPQTLSALIPAEAAQFDDLRACLFYVNQVRDSSVTLCLTVEGLQKTRGGEVEERFYLIEGRPARIVNFAWKLSTGGSH